MLAHKIQLIDKIDSLKYLQRKITLTGRLVKWVMVLSEFDIKYVDRKEIKGQLIVDRLAKGSLIDNNQIQIEFSNS